MRLEDKLAKVAIKLMAKASVDVPGTVDTGVSNIPSPPTNTSVPGASFVGERSFSSTPSPVKPPRKAKKPKSEGLIDLEKESK